MHVMNVHMELFRLAMSSLPTCTRCMRNQESVCFTIGIRADGCQYMLGEVVQMKCCGRFVRKICTFLSEEDASKKAYGVSQMIAFGGLGTLTLISVEMPDPVK